MRWLAALCAVAARAAGEAAPAFVFAGKPLRGLGTSSGPGEAPAYDVAPTTVERLRGAATAHAPAVAVFVDVAGGGAAAVVDAAARGATPKLAAHVLAKSSAVAPFAAPAPAADAVAVDAAAAAVAAGVTRVAAPSFGALDARLDDLVAAAQRAAGGDDYVFVVSAAEAAPRAPAAAAAPLRRLQSSSSKKDGVRMTPDVLTGILIALLFVFTALLGLTCIGSIQTPSQFSSVGPPSMKEF